jgi:hypothetical protein
VNSAGSQSVQPAGKASGTNEIVISDTPIASQPRPRRRSRPPDRHRLARSSAAIAPSTTTTTISQVSMSSTVVAHCSSSIANGMIGSAAGQGNGLVKRKPTVTTARAAPAIAMLRPVRVKPSSRRSHGTTWISASVPGTQAQFCSDCTNGSIGADGCWNVSSVHWAPKAARAPPNPQPATSPATGWATRASKT